MNITNYLYQPLLRPFDFRGKASRKEFLIWLAVSGVCLALWIPGYATLGQYVLYQLLPDWVGSPIARALGIGLYIPFLVTAIVGFSLGWRRLNQANRHKVELSIAFVCIVSVVCFGTYLGNSLSMVLAPAGLIAGLIAFIQICRPDRG